MLYQSFIKSVKNHSEKIAVSTPSGEITYSAIDILSNDIASLISRAYQRNVILFANVSPLYFSALVACMKRGAIAVPIDPSLSDGHINELVSRLNSDIWLCTADLVERAKQINGFEDKRIINLEITTQNQTTNEPDFELIKPCSLLHRVFTSGSSNNQTLVTISHETMIHDVINTSALYRFNPDTVIANFGRYTSSIGINGFWRICISGGSYVVFDLKTESLSNVWHRMYNSCANTLQGQPTTILKLISNHNEQISNNLLSHLIIGGEPLKPNQLSEIVNSLPCLEKISYNYSSTETMLIAAFSATPSEILVLDKIPVGLPGKDKLISIVDDQGDSVPLGEIGQIVVKSRYLASEINGKNTENRLSEDLTHSGVKQYFTGDLGRINKNGLLEHYGRIDRQIKIHGLRIDPIVIENELEKLPGIERAVVMSVELPGNKQRLVAGILTDERIAEMMLIKHLSTILPQSHIPQIYVNLNQIPQNANGKTDLNAIKELIISAIDNKELMVTNTEDKNSAIRNLLLSEWSKTLNEKITNTSDSIFQLGADSISIFNLTVRVNSALSTNLDPSWVFSNPSIDLQEIYLLSVLDLEVNNKSAFSIEQMQAMLGLE